MKKSLLFLIPVASLSLAFFSFYYAKGDVSKYHIDGVDAVSFSANPPAANTGAPGEATCTACHSGTVMSADGVVDFTVSGGPAYTPGESYPITVSTIGGPKNGFQMTILDESDNAAGTFTAGANTSIVSSGGRNYIRHSSSTGETAWNFTWNAPESFAGNLKAYFAVNKSNNNGSDAGDEIFVGDADIPAVEGASIQEDKVQKNYQVYYNTNLSQLNMSYSIYDEAKIVFNIQDLQGRLIQQYDLGIKDKGNYKELFSLDSDMPKGIYIVSLFVNNKVYNKKISLN
jgi:hypothetical protein